MAASHSGEGTASGSEPCSRLLLLNPPRDSLAHELAKITGGDVTAFTQEFADHDFLAAAGVDSTFGLLPQTQSAAWLPPTEARHLIADTTTLPAHTILFLPREKDRLDFLLHFLSAHMPAEGTLWLVGENKAGIKSAEPRLRERFAEVQKLDSARHCVLYQAVQPRSRSEADCGSEPCSRQAPPIGSMAASHSDQDPVRQEANQAFSLEDFVQHWTLPGPKGDLEFTSLPGSFAHGRLDKGTALLLEYLQSAQGEALGISGRVLDFGCGVGVIGLVLKQTNPSIHLTMVDTSASALESTRLSLQRNGFEADVFPADGLGKITGPYDWIISNPPFHAGIAADLGIAKQMIARAPDILSKQGRMLLVCNRHLPYEAWIDESFRNREQVCENREFKVILCRSGSGRDT
jgi:16S rRNA (guanine1207-N2)-methyltransferase